MKQIPKEILGIALDCYRYFILGRTGKDDGGLANLFEKVWKRTPGDYYPEVSELCLIREPWLADPASWTRDEVEDFAEMFYRIVSPDEPNYSPMGNLWKFKKHEERYVIYNPGENLFWSNQDGWVDRKSASVFTGLEKDSYRNIPGKDSRWVSASGKAGGK